MGIGDGRAVGWDVIVGIGVSRVAVGAGDLEGTAVGSLVGDALGIALGGKLVGKIVGSPVGFTEGASVSNCLHTAYA